MPFQIEWDIEGTKELSRVLRKIEQKAKDLKPPFKEASDNLKDLFEGEVFQSEGAVLKVNWERLSPYTVAQKARLGYGGKGILERTGRLRDSFKTIVSSDQAVIYNDTDYFKYHQSNAPRSKLPRRVMMKLGDNQKEMIVKVFQEYLREAMRK